MSIKSVGFLYQLHGKADITLVAKNKVKNFEQFNPKWRKSDPLFAIPDTHRLVPVELLERLLQENYLHPNESEACVDLVAVIGASK